MPTSRFCGRQAAVLLVLYGLTGLNSQVDVSHPDGAAVEDRRTPMGHDLPGVANSFTTNRSLAWFVWKTMNSISRAVPEVALQAIRKLITEQGFGPGDALPSQRDLAVQLGVSRASLREALSSLSALGVISIQPGKGVFVQSPVELPRGERRRVGHSRRRPRRWISSSCAMRWRALRPGWRR